MNTIHFTGYDGEHPSDFLFDSLGYSDCYLLIIFYSKSRIYKEGGTIECGPNTAILYPPNIPIHYGACGEPYKNDWIRFSSNEKLITNFPIQCEPFILSDPEYCHALVQLLTWETSAIMHTSRNYHNSGTDTTKNQEASALLKPDFNTVDILLRILFGKLREDVLHPLSSSHEQELLQLRKQIINMPEHNWNVPQMAKDLHISAGYLQFLYKKQFGISCMEDVIYQRMRKSADLLCYTDFSIASISEQCGYVSQEHFSRQFKKYFQMTAGQYRRQIHSKSI